MSYWTKSGKVRARARVRDRETEREKDRGRGEKRRKRKGRESYHYNLHHITPQHYRITKTSIAKHSVRSHARWSEICSPDGQYILVNPYEWQWKLVKNIFPARLSIYLSLSLSYLCMYVCMHVSILDMVLKDRVGLER